MRVRHPHFLTVITSCCILFFGSANADYVGSILGNKEDIKKGLTKKPLKEASYSPYAGQNYPTKVLWDDTHVHTNLSLDARAFGMITLGPEQPIAAPKYKADVPQSLITPVVFNVVRCRFIALLMAFDV